MKWTKLTLVAALASCVATLDAHASTIIKATLGIDASPDIELVDGVLSTFVDAVGATTGDQNTEVTFLETLSSQSPIMGDHSSFSMDDVLIVDTATVFGNTVLQKTSGGNFRLYDPNNVLLLSGTLGNGVLSGPIGGTSTGGFLTTEFGMFTGGSLLSSLSELPWSTLSISLTDVNSGSGMALKDDGTLANFSADGTAVIGASVPEPASIVILSVGTLGFFIRRHRRK
jgi:hypothetical protein